MGLVQSNLVVSVLRPIVRPDAITPLPSLAIDSCKFTDGSFGFLLTSVDLAKNMSSYTIPLKDVYSPTENTLVYIGKEESTLTFTRDLLTGRVFCTLQKYGAGTSLVRQCVSVYESIDNAEIDRMSKIFATGTIGN